jgi:hypothetical protein
MDKNNDLISYFSATFAEIRFFKKQMSTITNYSILIQAALVSGYKIITDSKGETDTVIFMIILSAVTAILSCCFMVSLHCSMKGVRTSQNNIAETLDKEFKKIFIGKEKSMEAYKLKTESFLHQIEFLILYLIINLGGSILAICIMCNIYCCTVNFQ